MIASPLLLEPAPLVALAAEGAVPAENSGTGALCRVFAWGGLPPLWRRRHRATRASLLRAARRGPLKELGVRVCLYRRRLVEAQYKLT